MKRPPHLPFPRQGVALVIVLAFLVLLTGICLAFFANALLERQLADASGRQAQTSSLAEAAVTQVIGFLKDEIVAGSEEGALYSAMGSAAANDPSRCFAPLSAATVAPQRMNTTAPNVVKWSTPGQAFFAGPAYRTTPAAFNAVTGLASTDPDSSANGRHVAETRWNLPALTTSGQVPTPNWIYLSRDGSHPVTWAASLADPSPTNPRYVVGRFAFVVYDQGGLLDLNAAGPPSTAPASETRLKGPLAYADLSTIDPNLANIVPWRNAGTAAQFPTAVRAATNTFRFAQPGDRLFTGRRQLLAFLRDRGVDEENFRFLTHFTRELNAPSWGPESNLSDQGSTRPYRDQRNTPGAANRLLPNVRVVAGSTYPVTAYEADGSTFTYQARPGDPLVRRRFSLDKLGWLTRNGPAAGREAAIRACFGLNWNAANGGWDYVGSQATPQASIATLDTVAAERREPNFFELLKAGILSGSLGMVTNRVMLNGDVIAINDWVPFNGTTARTYNAGVTTTPAQLSDSHVIQIGLNLLDQFDADSFPARIRFRGFDFYGRENVPYLYRFSVIPYRPAVQYAGMTPPGPDRRMVSCWLEPHLWNPVRGPSTDEPLRYRIRLLAGNISYYFTQTGGNTIGPTSPAATAAAGAQITYSGPGLGAHAVAPIPLGNLPEGVEIEGSRPEYRFDSSDPSGIPARWTGFWGGEIPLAPGAQVTAGAYTLNGDAANGGPRFVLEADYGDGAFREVQRFGFGATGGLYYGMGGTSPMNSGLTPGIRPRTFGVIDPRTGRFGVQGHNFDEFRQQFLERSQYWTATLTYGSQYSPKDAAFTPADPAGDLYFSRNTHRYGDNSGAESGPTYTDPDGVRRPGDGFWASAANNTLPMRSIADYRPVQLNRPFRSPAEMGYAFRDLPWRSLDFSSARSADAGLLDLFCVGSEGGADAVLAGRVNLNAAPWQVYRALLAGSARAEDPGGLTFTGTAGDTPAGSNELQNLAQAIANAVSATPLLTRADLATRIAPLTAAGAPFSNNIKTRREAVVRSLAQAGQTRTWNLMVDLVAQAGRFPPNAGSLARFRVEGEQRVWAHVALDRYSGQVLEIQIESIDE